MKKTYRCFASPKAVLNHSISVGIVLLLEIWMIFEKFYAGFLMLGIYIAVLLLTMRNAFSITHIDSEGIHNRHITVRWDEIKDFKLFDIRSRGVKTPLETIVGIGMFSGDYFFSQNTKKAVFFSLSKKNLEAIEQFCENKNEAVEDLISWKNFMKRF